VSDGGGADPRHDDRPWGSYDVLLDVDDCKVKRLVVNPGQRLSYQRHQHRAEHWVIVAGTGLVTLDGRDRDVATGDTVEVAVHVAHRIANPGTDPLVFIEVQTGTSFAEDDIERLSDDYGRAGSGA
jgi:mannose-6-phosphate isomerase-like protein (cupin superfamily)